MGSVVSDNVIKFEARHKPDQPDRYVLLCTNCDSRTFKVIALSDGDHSYLECANCEHEISSTRISITEHD